VEQWEDEKEMETILCPQVIYYRIESEMKKMDTQLWTPRKQR
jgi:hypothetical protein